MSDCMTFPDTVEEFMEQYKMIDAEHIYSNGTEYVPIFRMKQWFEHLPSAEPEIIRCKGEPMDDLIRRQDVLELIDSYNRDALGSVFGNYDDGMKFKYEVLKLPSAEPERKTGNRKARIRNDAFRVYV